MNYHVTFSAPCPQCAEVVEWQARCLDNRNEHIPNCPDCEPAEHDTSVEELPPANWVPSIPTMWRGGVW